MGTTALYHFGNNISSSRANYGGTKTVAVGSYPANAFGLHDMLGNVWERVEDCWHESYAGAPSDTNVWKAGDCSRRVLLGGSWRSGLPWIVRSANRFGNGFGSRGSGIGFLFPGRCCETAAYLLHLYLLGSGRSPSESVFL